MNYKCPGCKKPVVGGDPSMYHQNRYWHRTCHLERDPQYDLMDRLFKLQDDYKADSETALADLIGNLGHFATIQGIDFAEAVRRGLGYWEDER